MVCNVKLHLKYDDGENVVDENEKKITSCGTLLHKLLSFFLPLYVYLCNTHFIFTFILFLFIFFVCKKVQVFLGSVDSIRAMEEVPLYTLRVLNQGHN